MSSLVRTQIFLTSDQRKRLRAWSILQKKTASELIREAIEAFYVRRPTPGEFQAALDRAFGAWKRRKRTSVQIVRELRRGRRLRTLLS